MNTAPTGKPAVATPALPRTAGTMSVGRHGVLRRALSRVVAFVVPPDDKIAQTWRWIQ
ncbi:hypothetical protein ACQEVI_05330 [Promicromonospora sp. CA-289599]|uniref:hypothetical protein n=1 Tax=Promicromonospora sp. CA-289599 TaxID=3240014 RepID=UPI003D94235E